MSESDQVAAIKKTTLLLMFLTIITKVIGFTREIIISYFYGASGISDAYLIALTIPGSIFSIVGLSIATGYIPMYSKIEKEKGTKAANQFTNHFINCNTLILLVIIAFVFLFTRWFVLLYASGFDEQSMALAISFTRISIFGILFTGLVYVYVGYLNIKNNFIIPALMSIPFNLSIIVAIIISYYYNQRLLPVGNVISEFLQFILLLPFVLRYGFRHNLKVTFKDPYLLQISTLSLPVILGSSVGQINNLIDKTIASRIVEGGISSLNYANRLNSFVQGIFTVSIVTTFYPITSKLFATKNMEGYKSEITKAINIVILFVLPTSIGLMLLAKPVVIFLFGHGAFNKNAVLLTSSSLFFYSLGMLGNGLKEVLSKAFYAMQDTKTPMTNSIIAMILNAILSVVLSYFLGIGGIALAASSAAIITTFLLFIRLHKKIGAIGMKKVILTFFKVSIASLCMGFLTVETFQLLRNTLGMTPGLLLSVLLGFLTYFILIYMMKLDVALQLMTIVKAKLSNNKYSKSMYLRYQNWKTKGTSETAENEDLLLIESFILPSLKEKNSRYVGIIVVTNNQSATLLQTLNSILNQAYPYYKIFIIDNGSTDGTNDLMKSFFHKSKRPNDYLFALRNIGYYRLRENLGRAGGFYYGMKLAYEYGVPYVWCLEDDVILHKNSLNELVYSAQLLDSKACLQSNMTTDLEESSIWKIGNSQHYLQNKENICFNGFFASTQMLRDIGYPRKALYLFFDEAEYTKRAGNAGYKIYQVRNSYIRYHQRSYDDRSLSFAKINLLSNLNSWMWYYYMRNAILVHSKREHRTFRRKHFLLLCLVIIKYPEYSVAAIEGYLDGKRGVVGKSTKYLP